jgi:nicotinic acid mononucleotide adenylyltransferase
VIGPSRDVRPPTIAHLAIAEAAHRRCELDHLDLVVNATPIAKAGAQAIDERIALLDAVAASGPWLAVARRVRALNGRPHRGFLESR